MSVLIDSLLNGLTLGALYALVTLGLALILGVARLVNFAHGDFFMLGGYAIFLLRSATVPAMPYPLAVLVTVIAIGAFGIVFERLVVHRIIDRSWRVQLVATLASSIILSNAALLLFTSDPRQVPTEFASQTVEIFGASTSLQRLLVLAVGIAAFLWLQWFLGKTKTGKAMRAISQNRETCVVVGIDVRRITLVTFGLSASLAGLAGALLTPLLSVTPTMGSLLTIKALAAVIMGGMGQVTGGFYAAFLLGLIESFFAAYVPDGFAYKDVASFVILLGVLVMRPHGLFGRKIGL